MGMTGSHAHLTEPTHDGLRAVCFVGKYVAKIEDAAGLLDER
jgi:hypothetical protein